MSSNHILPINKLRFENKRGGLSCGDLPLATIKNVSPMRAGSLFYSHLYPSFLKLALITVQQ